MFMSVCVCMFVAFLPSNGCTSFDKNLYGLTSK